MTQPKTGSPIGTADADEFAATEKRLDRLDAELAELRRELASVVEPQEVVRHFCKLTTRLRGRLRELGKQMVASVPAEYRPAVRDAWRNRMADEEAAWAAAIGKLKTRLGLESRESTAE